MRHSILWSFFILISLSCSKERIIASQEQHANPIIKNTVPSDADVVYYYKEVAYPLHFQEGSTQDFIKDENYDALLTAAQNATGVFTYSDLPKKWYFLFDTEYDGYDYMEKNGHALIGRKFKLSYRIDQLREALISSYGLPLDFTNTNLIADARMGIEAIYQELHLNLPFPRDIAAFIGIEQSHFSSNSGRNNPVLTVWEHDTYRGQQLVVDQDPHTFIWTYGDYGCFTMAANPDLTIVNKPDGSNWNDCISSKCLSYISGADAIAEGYYKDINYGVYACGFAVQITYANQYNPVPACYNMRDQNWVRGWCGHMNDQISSIRIKAVWQGCYTDDSVFNDLYNQ